MSLKGMVAQRVRALDTLRWIIAVPVVNVEGFGFGFYSITKSSAAMCKVEEENIRQLRWSFRLIASPSDIDV
jgi:hypothetical protein